MKDGYIRSCIKLRVVGACDERSRGWGRYVPCLWTPYKGLLTASGIAGLIALSVSLFNECVRGIAILSAARHIGEDVNRIACVLDYEEYRLLQWGIRVGFHPGGHPNHLLKWEIGKEILKHLHELLTDAHVLKERYNLEYIEDDRSSFATTARKSALGRKGIGRLWSHASPNLKRSRAEIIQEQTSPLRRLRWAVLDQDKMRHLVDEIAKFNNYLHSLLAKSDQDFLHRAVAVLLRDLISRSPESSDIDLIKVLLDQGPVSGSDAIDAAATVKQTRLLLGVDKRVDEISNSYERAQAQTKNGSTFQGPIRPRQILSRLKYACLIRDTNNIGKGKETAIYRVSSTNKSRHARVLVEWKQVDKRADAKLGRRIQELSLLLCNLSDRSFHSLKCLGYLKHTLDGDFHNYAYVYELVDMNGDERPETFPTVSSLSQLLDAPRKPSLTQRIRICIALAETILQLHTAGWLHKNICADNVLFIDKEPHSCDDGMRSGPYLLGYEFTRNSLEETEKMPADSELNLYRHPKAQPDSGHSFRKAFDLYALGCILLVVTLWESLDEILSRAHEKLESTVLLAPASSKGEKASQKWTNILKGKEYLSDEKKIKEILDRVAFSAGNSATKAIETCFFPMQDRLEDDEEDEDILEVSVNVQISIVDLLEPLREI